jgi:hypothetical protein
VKTKELNGKSKEGWRSHTDLSRSAVYSADRGQAVHDLNATGGRVVNRSVVAHGEIDRGVGGKEAARPVLMTRTKCKTRKILIRKLADKTQPSALKASGRQRQRIS